MLEKEEELAINEVVNELLPKIRDEINKKGVALIRVPNLGHEEYDKEIFCSIAKLMFKNGIVTGISTYAGALVPTFRYATAIDNPPTPDSCTLEWQKAIKEFNIKTPFED